MHLSRNMGTARQTPWIVVLLVLLAIVLAVLPLLLLPESLPDTQAVLASVGSIVILVFALFSLVRDTFTARQMAAALSIVVAVVASALLVWREVEERRALTVTDGVELTGASSMEDGDTATVRMRAAGPRDLLRITFEGKDLALGSPCAQSVDTFVRITSGQVPGVTSARMNERVSLVLSKPSRSLRLEAQLETAQFCELRLHVSEAVLDND